MSQSNVKMNVYGSERPCPSCLHSPSSRETYEWLQAAISRKYPSQAVLMEYIDIDDPLVQNDSFVKATLNGELFYPLVVLNGKVVGEGDPKLKTIFAELEELGYR